MNVDPRISGQQLYILGVLLIVMFFLLAFYVLWRSAPLSPETASMMLQGAQTITVAAVMFFFGASAARRKEEDRPSGSPSDPISTTVENAASQAVPVEAIPFSEPTSSATPRTTGDG